MNEITHCDKGHIMHVSQEKCPRCAKDAIREFLLGLADRLEEMVIHQGGCSGVGDCEITAWLVDEKKLDGIIKDARKFEQEQLT